MMGSLRILACIVMLMMCGNALAQTAPTDQAEIQAAFADVDLVDRTFPWTEGMLATLARDIAVFDAVLNNRDLTPEALMLTRYYRARAKILTSQVSFALDKPPLDAEAKRAVLQELDAVIQMMTGNAAGSDAWQSQIATANYLAGQMTVDIFNDISLANKYYIACAALDQIACVNIMANAYLGGDGTERDVNEAVRLHKIVYASGIRYSCAGSYSALSLAHLLATGAASSPGDIPEAYISGGLALHEQLAKRLNTEAPCGNLPVSFYWTQYYLSLSRGQPDGALLDKIAAYKLDEDDRDLVDYLKKNISAQELERRTAARTEPEAQCAGYFFLMWEADIKRDAPRARYLRDRIAGIDDRSCRINMGAATGFRTLR